MTFIEDPEHSIKNAEVCKLKEADLRKQYKISEPHFQKVDDQVIKLVLQRCEGNPLVSLHFLFNLMAVTKLVTMIQNDYLVQKGTILEPTNKFKKCL